MAWSINRRELKANGCNRGEGWRDQRRQEELYGLRLIRREQIKEAEEKQ